MKENTIIKSVHEFKKHFFPYTYKQELISELTDEEKMELIVRRSLKNTESIPAKSIKVANIEDLEKSNS